LIRAVESLVARGHNESDVVEKYSIRKIFYYQEAIEKNKNREMKELAIAVRNGSLLPDDVFRNWLRG
jgi:hypothetical protein